MEYLAQEDRRSFCSSFVACEVGGEDEGGGEGEGEGEEGEDDYYYYGTAALLAKLIYT